MDLEVTIAVVCAISHEVQNIQINAVRSIINPVVPEVDSSQHGVSCSENCSCLPSTCTIMGGHLNPGSFAECAVSKGLNVPLNACIL